MTLTPEDRARIEAEEAYRKQLKAKKSGGCFKWGCGGLLGLTVIVAAFSMWAASMGGGTSSTPSAPTSTYNDGAFMADCESAVKARLNYPDTAQFVSAFNVGLNGEITRDAQTTRWDSEVKAKNAFGVPDTITFVCTKSQGESSVRVQLSQ